MIISIDPGKSGAWAVWDGETLIDTYKIRTPTGQRYLSTNTLRDLHLSIIGAPDLYQVVIEGLLDKHMPSQSPVANNTTASNHGRLSAVVAMTNSELVEVRPATWKTKLGLSNADKSASVALAIELGYEKFLMKPRMRVPNVDIAEAILIGVYYGRKELGWKI